MLLYYLTRRRYHLVPSSQICQSKEGQSTGCLSPLFDFVLLILAMICLCSFFIVVKHFWTLYCTKALYKNQLCVLVAFMIIILSALVSQVLQTCFFLKHMPLKQNVSKSYHHDSIETVFQVVKHFKTVHHACKLTSSFNSQYYLCFTPFKKPQLLRNSATYPEACFTGP